MKKRIAFVVNTLSGGGAEKTVSNLSRGLADKYNIDIIVNDTQHLEYPYRGHIVSLNMPPDKGVMGAAYQIQILIRRTKVLRYLKKKKKYTAVLSFSEMCNVANVLSGNKYGKTIVSVRNSILKGKDSSWMHKLISPVLLPWCYRTSDKTVSCSKGIADELREHYGLMQEKSAVVYNGVDLPLIRKKTVEVLTEEEKKDWAGKQLIVTVGRLTRQKGQIHLIRAVMDLIGRGISVHLLILGEGELRETLESEAEKLSINDSVSFTGFVENPYKYMANAAVVVMPSLYEGMCNVILEALACGVPVISTDHETGAREILAPKTDYKKKVTDRIDEAAYGILVPVCGENSGRTERNLSKEEMLMADAIEKILTDDALAAHYKTMASERVEQMDIRSACEQWSRLIEE